MKDAIRLEEAYAESEMQAARFDAVGDHLKFADLPTRPPDDLEAQEKRRMASVAEQLAAGHKGGGAACPVCKEQKLAPVPESCHRQCRGCSTTVRLTVKDGGLEAVVIEPPEEVLVAIGAPVAVIEDILDRSRRTP